MPPWERINRSMLASWDRAALEQANRAVELYRRVDIETQNAIFGKFQDFSMGCAITPPKLEVSYRIERVCGR